MSRSHGVNKQKRHSQEAASSQNLAVIAYVHPQFDSKFAEPLTEDFMDFTPSQPAPTPAPPRKSGPLNVVPGKPGNLRADPVFNLSIDPETIIQPIAPPPPSRVPLQQIPQFVQPPVNATPVKRSLRDDFWPQSSSKRARHSLGPDDSMTAGAEQVLRMLDDSLVDTPERSFNSTPRVQRSAPGPSPRNIGPSYAYEARSHVELYGVLPPRPVWTSAWKMPVINRPALT